MPSNARTQFEALRKKGLPDREAIFAVIDHFNDQHWHDRNRYGEEIKNLKAENAEIRDRLAKLERPGE